MGSMRLNTAVVIVLLVLLSGSGTDGPVDAAAGIPSQNDIRGNSITEIYRLPGDSRAALELFDGGARSPAITLTQWRQLVFEMSKAAADGGSWPGIFEIDNAARHISGSNRVPLALALFAYRSVDSGMVDRGELRLEEGRLVPEEMSRESSTPFPLQSAPESHTGHEEKKPPSKQRKTVVRFITLDLLIHYHKARDATDQALLLFAITWREKTSKLRLKHLYRVSKEGFTTETRRTPRIKALRTSFIRGRTGDERGVCSGRKSNV